MTFEFLYLPGETEYQSVPNGKESQALAYYMFGDWVLSNFKTIDEVKQAINGVYVVPLTLPQLGTAILPGHASIYDTSGNGIVIEFYDNKIIVSENIGVMTNSPKYNWHVTNLRNYLNLSPINVSPIIEKHFIFSATVQGSGSVGLPGDASSPIKPRVHFIVEGDAGKANSHHSYDVQAYLGYQPVKPILFKNLTLYVGYRYLHQYFSSGRRLEYYLWDMDIRDPVLGFKTIF